MTTQTNNSSDDAGVVRGGAGLGPGCVGQHRVYVVQGDITQIAADITVYPTDAWGTSGNLPVACYWQYNPIN